MKKEDLNKELYKKHLGIDLTNDKRELHIIVVRGTVNCTECEKHIYDNKKQPIYFENSDGEWKKYVYGKDGKLISIITDKDKNLIYDNENNVYHEVREEEVSAPEKEMVDSPEHYNKTQFETIVEMYYLFGEEDVLAFCKLNAYKYKARAMFKDNPQQDLDKADWYLNQIKIIKTKGEKRNELQQNNKSL